jgi:hypothetical protein
MFGLLRYDGKANGKEPERQKERTLEHAELKTKSQQTPAEFFAQDQAINHSVMLSGAKHPATSTDCSGWLACEMVELGIQHNYPN